MTTAYYYSSGSWTCPAGLTTVSVRVIGGGGGGGKGGAYDGGDGGGAGSQATGSVSVSPGTTYSFTVGAGGAGGVGGSGEAGETSSGFGLSAAGGSGGAANVSFHGGLPGDSTGYGSGNAEAGQNGYWSGGSAGSGAGAGGGGGGSGDESGIPGGHGSYGAVILTYYVSTPIIGATPTIGNAPLDVTFSGSVSEGTVGAWAWNFGDGGTSGTQNPTHQYTIVGAKTVTLTVTTSYGSWSTTATVTVYWRPSAHVFVISTEPWRR